MYVEKGRKGIAFERLHSCAICGFAAKALIDVEPFKDNLWCRQVTAPVELGVG